MTVTSSINAFRYAFAVEVPFTRWTQTTVWMYPELGFESYDHSLIAVEISSNTLMTVAACRFRMHALSQPMLRKLNNRGNKTLPKSHRNAALVSF
jgi:hypothetical protein